MATLSYIREQEQNASAMKRVIRSCAQDHKVTDPETERRYVSGVNCDGENSFAEFMTTKKCFHKTNGIYFYQYTQSFSPDENITPATAHEIALEFAERAWLGHEVMVATHVDREHIQDEFCQGYFLPKLFFSFRSQRTKPLTERSFSTNGFFFTI